MTSILDRARDLEMIDNLDPNVLGKVMRLEMLNSYALELTKNHKMKQKDICKKIDISQSSLHRYQKDLGMSSFHRSYNNNKIRTKAEQPIDSETILETITPDDKDLIKKCILERKSNEDKKVLKDDEKKEKLRIRNIRQFVMKTKDIDQFKDDIVERTTTTENEIIKNNREITPNKKGSQN